MKENLPEEGIQRMARRTDDVKMHRAGTGSSAAEEGAEVAKLMLTSETPWTLPGRPGGGGGGQHSTAQSSVYLPVWFHRLPALGLQQVTSSAALCEVFSGIIYAKCLAEQITFSIIVPSYWFLAQNRHFIDVNVLPNLLRGSFLITT